VTEETARTEKHAGTACRHLAGDELLAQARRRFAAAALGTALDARDIALVQNLSDALENATAQLAAERASAAHRAGRFADACAAAAIDAFFASNGRATEAVGANGPETRGEDGETEAARRSAARLKLALVRLACAAAIERTIAPSPDPGRLLVDVEKSLLAAIGNLASIRE
jgi:hypothetical protein